CATRVSTLGSCSKDWTGCYAGPMRAAALCLVALFVALPSRAQEVDVARLARTDPVRAALNAIQAAEAETIADQIRLCEIPAPPFKEEARARAYADAFRAAGLTNVRIDRVGNVLGERPGRLPRPNGVISSHLDTVFPEGTDGRVRRDGARLHGPRTGGDCRGRAGRIAVVR